ncbi:hypothetical protein B0H13DRAFT_1911496 [Mycena leptocephala]|nr:hypothetical protein B0H13DRAFT_1911496 [Mycena leptocephala]
MYRYFSNVVTISRVNPKPAIVPIGLSLFTLQLYWGFIHASSSVVTWRGYPLRLGKTTIRVTNTMTPCRRDIARAEIISPATSGAETIKKQKLLIRYGHNNEDPVFLHRSVDGYQLYRFLPKAGATKMAPELVVFGPITYPRKVVGARNGAAIGDMLDWGCWVRKNIEKRLRNGIQAIAVEAASGRDHAVEVCGLHLNIWSAVEAYNHARSTTLINSHGVVAFSHDLKHQWVCQHEGPAVGTYIIRSSMGEHRLLKIVNAHVLGLDLLCARNVGCFCENSYRHAERGTLESLANKMLVALGVLEANLELLLVGARLPASDHNPDEVISPGPLKLSRLKFGERMGVGISGAAAPITAFRGRIHRVGGAGLTSVDLCRPGSAESVEPGRHSQPTRWIWPRNAVYLLAARKE